MLTQLSSYLDESRKTVNAHKELQIEEVLSVFDQKLMILILLQIYEEHETDNEIQ